MARETAKTTSVTLDEKLEQALVCENEQLYSMPENWCWVHLGAILKEIKNGTTIKQDKSGQGFSVTRIESLQNQTIDFSRLGTINNETEIKDNDWYIADDIALSHINSAEHVGKTALVTKDMLPLVHGMNLLRLRFAPCCLAIYFQYYSQTYQYKEEINERINMAVNQVSINQKQLSTLEFPLPPLAEQRRIVDRIENLFSKLDEAKEKVLDVVDGFETRKAAILHKAFTGELTVQWRKEHGLILNYWKTKPFGEIIHDIRLGLVRGRIEQSYDRPYAYFKMNNITSDGNVNLSDLICVDATADEIEQYSLLKGDFLFNTRNSYELVGKNTVWNANDGGVTLYNNNIMRVRFISSVNPDYVSYYLNSLRGKRDLDKKKKNTTNIAAIYAKDLNQIDIILAPYDEQIEIVRIVDILLAKEYQAKESAESALQQIDLIKKSILARAFRGELGTNDPTEESAIELLKSVL